MSIIKKACDICGRKKRKKNRLGGGVCKCQGWEGGGRSRSINCFVKGSLLDDARFKHRT